MLIEMLMVKLTLMVTLTLTEKPMEILTLTEMLMD